MFRVTFHKSYTPSECETLSVLDGFWLWFLSVLIGSFDILSSRLLAAGEAIRAPPCAFSSRRSLKWNLSMEKVRQNPARIVDIIAFDSHVELIQSVFFSPHSTAIINEMKRVQLKIQEEKEKEKKIYAKMFS